MGPCESRKAIAVVGPMWPYRGGISAHTSELYSALRNHHNGSVFGYSFKRQYPARLYPFESDKDPSYSPDYRHEEAEYRIDSINPISWTAFWRNMRRKHVQWLIVPWWHVFFFPFVFTTVLFSKARGIKVLLIVHNVEDHEPSFWRGVLSRLVFGIADLFLVQNRMDFGNLRKQTSEKRILVHSQPLFSQYDRLEGYRDDRMLSGKTRVRVLSFGFVRPYKGIDILLDACEVLESLQLADFVIAGEWADKGGVHHQRATAMHERGALRLLDHYLIAEEVSRFFEWADVVVLPYVATTGSAVIATAFHFRKPVIATRNGFFEDWIIEGENGFLVPMKDHEALAKSIRRIPDLKAEVVERTIEEVTRSMTWGHMAEIILQRIDPGETAPAESPG